MHHLVMGCNNPKWEDYLKDKDFQIKTFHCENCQDDSDFTRLRGAMTVFDKKTYDELPDSIKESIHRSNLVLILPGDPGEEERDRYRKLALATFYTPSADGGSELSEEINFTALMERLFERRLILSRLDEYIKSSFQDIVNTNLLEKQKKEIEVLNAKLQEINRIDSLTHLLNRRAVMEAFAMEKKRALRDRWRLSQVAKSTMDIQEPKEDHQEEFESELQGRLEDHIGNFSCIMVDLDHFKQVNDVYGHLLGDQVLEAFGTIIHEKGIFRENDIIGRYGGEEFIIILPGTNAENARIPAERLRTKFREYEFKSEQGNPFHVTLSLGVAQFLPDEATINQLISRADRALYYAKNNGRDQVCLYQDLPETQKTSV